ncbi:hypothetical protein [Peribacillus frigoritolerans]|uniref:hypothetical protein n=1 Tax=Peribacillus frigoritolerans TaxID=450367 RepID=UPI0037FF0CE9
MIKLTNLSRKKIGAFIMTGAIVASSFSFSTSADAAGQSYASSSFGYGVYVGGGYGTTFSLDGTAHFEATHKAVYSGDASGVVYQIKSTDGTTVESNQEAGAITDKWVSVNGPEGKRKAYLRNMYNEATPQKASGDFKY